MFRWLDLSAQLNLRVTQAPNLELPRGFQLWLCSSKGSTVGVLHHAPEMPSISAPSRKCSVFLDFQAAVLIRTQGAACLWSPAHLRDQCHGILFQSCAILLTDQRSIPLSLFPLSCSLFIFPLHNASCIPAPKHFPMDSLPVEVRRRSAHSVNVYTINFALSILEDNSPCF